MTCEAHHEDEHNQTSSDHFQRGSLDCHAGTRHDTQEQSTASLRIRTRLFVADAAIA
jgi:hypothetical protein